MKIILAAPDPYLADAWQAACGDLDGVTVHQGSIFEVDCDALVSPANSFGFMDGGIDALYTERFGWAVETRLRRAILERHYGELLIGRAEIVETGDAAHPYLIAAPTMRVPMALPVETINPYLATRAVLRLVKHGHFSTDDAVGNPIAARIETVAFPGMGTGVGRVPVKIAARQMRAAFDEIRAVQVRMPQSWAEASEDHQRLYTDHPTRLQY